MDFPGLNLATPKICHCPSFLRFFFFFCTKNVEAASSCLELIKTIWQEHSGVLILEMTKPLLALQLESSSSS